MLRNAKGFSLVELVVVIAIMAVLLAVLAPSMLYYTERSRAQKDNSTMDEVVNEVMLALAGSQDIYDEVLTYTTYGNISSYVDTPTSDEIPDKIKTRDAQGTWKEQYMFGPDARLKDEMIYYAAGNMRGMTITFCPEMGEKKPEYVLSNAIINKYIRDEIPESGNGSPVLPGREDNVDPVRYVNDTPDYTDKGTLGTMTSGDSSTPFLYHRLRSSFTEKIVLSSQTYRNSEYTVFVRMSSIGGNAVTRQQSVQVYGQWNGTNLTAID